MNQIICKSTFIFGIFCQNLNLMTFFVVKDCERIGIKITKALKKENFFYQN
jgi:hypothetical protein